MVSTFLSRNVRAKAFISWALVIIISLLASACSKTTVTSNTTSSNRGGRGEGGAERGGADLPAIPVTTTRAESHEIPTTIEATGSLTATESSDVASQTSGQVVSTPINVGAFVHKGDVVARLNDRDARLRLQQAKANEQQAVAGIRQAEARLGLGPNGHFDASTIPEVRTAAATYDSAVAQQRLAEANARRYADLVETGDVARSVYDQYRTQADTARAQANSARQQLDTAINLARQNNQAIQTAQAGLESARATTAIAAKSLADTIIRAPYAGYVSARPIAIGEYVTPASVVATILLTNPLKLQLQVPELEAPRVQVGMAVVLTVDAYPDRKFSGRISAINPAIDPTSRAFTVEAEVENPDNALRSGMFVTARISLPGGKSSVFVPRDAVVNDQNTNSSRVFTIDGTTAHLQVVQIGDEENGMVQILTGVNPDAEVATSNLQQLYEGAKVQPTRKQ
jgi:multidrug efflux pump subunit AcrA (membrane-fusion protein)